MSAFFFFPILYNVDNLSIMKGGLFCHKPIVISLSGQTVWFGLSLTESEDLFGHF